jgi:hypothetical protein
MLRVDGLLSPHLLFKKMQTMCELYFHILTIEEVTIKSRNGFFNPQKYFKPKNS